MLDSERILYVVGDGRKGYEPEAPYHAIHVGAAAPRIPDEVFNFLILFSVKIGKVFHDALNDFIDFPILDCL